MNEHIHSKFGNAKLRNDGYYQITSSKEGNYGKILFELEDKVIEKGLEWKKLDN